MKKNSYIVLIGKPGSGKGTIAKQIIEKFGYSLFTMGDVYRKHMKDRTPLGIRIQEIMDSGNLVDDQTTIGVFREYIESLPEGSKVIIDGYPRSVEQFDSVMDTLETKPRIVLLDVDDQVCFERIQKRALTQNRTEDADDGVIRRRLEIFNDKMVDIANRLKSIDPDSYELTLLDASKEPDVVFEEFLCNIGELKLELDG